MVKIIGYWCWSSFSSWRPRTLEFGKVVGLGIGRDLIVGQVRPGQPAQGRAWNPGTGLTLAQAGDRFWSGS